MSTLFGRASVIAQVLLLAALARCAAGDRSTRNGPVACSAVQPCPAGMSCGFAPGCDRTSGVCQDSACGALPVARPYCGCDGRAFQGSACRPGVPYRSEGECPPPVVRAARTRPVLPEPAPDPLPPDFVIDGRPVPIDNRYTEAPGCYVGCYSTRASQSAFPLGGDLYMHGLVRIAGAYDSGVCRPTGRESADISLTTSTESVRCREVIPSCSGARCWAGGDTGGFVGR